MREPATSADTFVQTYGAAFLMGNLASSSGGKPAMKAMADELHLSPVGSSDLLSSTTA